MTARDAARHTATTWKDWIVLVGLGINLLAVGAIYGDVRATLGRAVADVSELESGLAHESAERRSEDSRLRDEYMRGDKWLNEAMLALCGGK